MMAMLRKRPLEDPNQYYAYVWRLRGKVIYVGYGKNNRCRPDCKSSWGGRCSSLIDMLRGNYEKIKVEVIPQASRELAWETERKLIALLKPKYNTAPGVGGYPGMHTTQGLHNIGSAASRTHTAAERESARLRMLGNKHLLGHTHTKETRQKISQTLKGRKPSDLCRQKARERAVERNTTNPPRKGVPCSPEHRAKLSAAAKARSERKHNNVRV
jgi:hypothetical protein